MRTRIVFTLPVTAFAEEEAVDRYAARGRCDYDIDADGRLTG
jgi:hypothetical protein